LSVTLGRFIDTVFAEDGNIKRALFDVGGVQFSVIAGVVLFATFIPRGSWYLNPDVLFDDSVKDRPTQSISVWSQYRPILSRPFRLSPDTGQVQGDRKLATQLRYD